MRTCRRPICREHSAECASRHAPFVCVFTPRDTTAANPTLCDSRQVKGHELEGSSAISAPASRRARSISHRPCEVVCATARAITGFDVGASEIAESSVGGLVELAAADRVIVFAHTGMCVDVVPSIDKRLRLRSSV
jgi:hypothetical protein